jgi:hypothetical protein
MKFRFFTRTNRSKSKFELLLRTFIDIAIWTALFRFLSTVIGFGLKDALFGGKFQFPVQGFLFFILIHSVSSLLVYLFFSPKDITDVNFNWLTFVMDLILFVIVLVGSLFFI